MYHPVRATWDNLTLAPDDRRCPQAWYSLVQCGLVRRRLSHSMSCLGLRGLVYRHMPGSRLDLRIAAAWARAQLIPVSITPPWPFPRSRLARLLSSSSSSSSLLLRPRIYGKLVTEAVARTQAGQPQCVRNPPAGRFCPLPPSNKSRHPRRGVSMGTQRRTERERA